MKLEVGKTYELTNGEVHECTEMFENDPCNVDRYGFGPFVIAGTRYHQDGTFGSGKQPKLNVIRCVDDTPTLWRDMTPDEKGALLLAHHEGKEIEAYGGTSEEWCPARPAWNPNAAYRVKPEPTVETVVMYTCNPDKHKTWGWTADEYMGTRTHRITFNLIDGKPNTASIKMEEL